MGVLDCKGYGDRFCVFSAKQGSDVLGLTMLWLESVGVFGCEGCGGDTVYGC